MIVKYNIELLNRIIKDIFDLTGIAVSVLDINYKVLAKCIHEQDYCSVLHKTKIESIRCHECDSIILEKCAISKKLEKHICFTGLYDAAMPIIKNDNIVGYAIMGRVRSTNSPVSPNLPPCIEAKTAKKLAKLYSELPFITESKLAALYDLLLFVVFDNAIQIVYDSIVTEIVDFIDLNFCENLSIKYLCSKFHISKNHLYKTFNNNLGCTVNMYITECRLNYAKTLLSNSGESIYQIAQNVGIANYAYFCKLFKKRNGVTPTEYRKNITIKTPAIIKQIPKFIQN